MEGNVNFFNTSYPSNHISGSVAEDFDDQLWFFNGIYGFPEEQNKRKTWFLIKELIEKGGDKVLCVGDFNDVLTENEKHGGILRTPSKLS